MNFIPGVITYAGFGYLIWRAFPRIRQDVRALRVRVPGARGKRSRGRVGDL
jgi:threonine/homoserine/homoserine lactone efflux protein